MIQKIYFQWACLQVPTSQEGSDISKKPQEGVIGRKCSSPPHTTTEKLQLKYRTTITQNHQKNELYGSLTTKILKKSLSFRQVGGTEGWRHGDVEPAGSRTSAVDIKERDISGVSDPTTTPDQPAQGSSARKIRPLTFGCKKQWGLGRQKKLPSSQASLLKGPLTVHGLIQTHSPWAPALGQHLEGHQRHMGRN